VQCGESKGIRSGSVRDFEQELSHRPGASDPLRLGDYVEELKMNWYGKAALLQIT